MGIVLIGIACFIALIGIYQQLKLHTQALDRIAKALEQRELGK